MSLYPSIYVNPAHRFVESLNSLPRQPNGMEDAHDYLWAAQDLWMKDEIWNWVNEQPEIKAVVLKAEGLEGG